MFFVWLRVCADAFNIIVENSCSLVMDNMYTESTIQNYHLSGGPNDPPGRVTLSAVKEEQTPPSSELGVLAGYRGTLSVAGAGWFFGYGPDKAYSIRSDGVTGAC